MPIIKNITQATDRILPKHPASINMVITQLAPKNIPTIT